MDEHGSFILGFFHFTCVSNVHHYPPQEMFSTPTPWSLVVRSHKSSRDVQNSAVKLVSHFSFIRSTYQLNWLFKKKKLDICSIWDAFVLWVNGRNQKPRKRHTTVKWQLLKSAVPFFLGILDLIRSGISPIIALRDVRIVGNNGMQYLPSLQFVIETNTE